MGGGDNHTAGVNAPSPKYILAIVVCLLFTFNSFRIFSDDSLMELLLSAVCSKFLLPSSL